MKPPEILSMIEEAAGTRMFETKKINAQKTLEKKQLKVNEITHLMDNEIKPGLEKLRGEQANYSKWSTNCSELERLGKVLIAHDYYSNEEKVRLCKDEQVSLEDALKEKASLWAERLEQSKGIEAKVADLKKQASSGRGALLNDVKKRESAQSVEVVRLNVALVNLKDNVEQEGEALVGMQAQIAASNKAIQTKEGEVVLAREVLSRRQEEVEQAEALVKSVTESYENALAGDVGEGNTNLLSVPEQIAKWEKEARDAQTKIQQMKLQVTHVTESLNGLRKKSVAEEKANMTAVRAVETCRSALEEVQKRLQDAGFSESDMVSAKSIVDEMRQKVGTLRDRRDRVAAQVEARLKFEFKDPEKGFDRSRVKGVVARLVRVKDKESAVALEVAAAGKLGQVIVDTDETSRLLLQRGALKKRTTFCPLNKIQGNSISEARLQVAASVAKSKGSSASLALNLVDFDEELRRAMVYVFGNTLVCGRADVANAVTYHPDVRARCVTLDGDCYNTNGTLSGGSKASVGDLLLKLAELTALTEELTQAQRELRQAEGRLSEVQSRGAAVAALESEIRLKAHELATAEDCLKRSKFAAVRTEIEAKEKELLRLQQVDLHMFITILFILAALVLLEVYCYKKCKLDCMLYLVWDGVV